MLTKLRNVSASRTLRFYQDTERNCRDAEMVPVDSSSGPRVDATVVSSQVT